MAYQFQAELLEKVKEYYDSGAYKPNPYRASSSGECARKLAFTKLFPEMVSTESPDARTYSIFALGNLLHDAERDLYNELGYTITNREASVESKLLMDDFTELTIRGKIDGMIEVGGEKILFDIKTAGNGGFNKAKSMGIPYTYKCQAQLYLDALKLDKMWFIYYNKDTSERLVMEYESDMNISHSVLRRFSSVYNTTSEEDAPAREYLPYRRKEKGRITNTVVLDAHCATCPFREKCYPQFNLDEKGTHWVQTSEVYTGPYSK